MTNDNIRKHLLYYVALIVIEVLGLGLLSILAHDRYMQFMIICFMSTFYVGWAILHHYHHHDLNPKIMFEYVLIGLLGIVISFLIFQQL